MKDRKGLNSLSVDKTRLALQSESVFAKVARGFEAGVSEHHPNNGFRFLSRYPRPDQNRFEYISDLETYGSQMRNA